MFRIGIAFSTIAVIFSLSVSAQTTRPDGSLFIIGGGNRSDQLISELLRTADLGNEDHIVVLPMSSAEPLASFESIAAQLTKLGGNKIGMLNFNSANVSDPKWIDSLTRAKLIYITGGDQNRLMEVVLNTPVFEAIHRAYQRGSTIAGTSAGAAVMSKFMITGRQSLGDTTYRETFNKLWNDNIVFEPGLGLLSTVIIDQHFVKRSRYNRLISAMNEFPGYNCIGIDEGTALIVHRNRARIAGESQVVRFHNPKRLQSTPAGLIKFREAGFSIFTEGDEFKL